MNNPSEDIFLDMTWIGRERNIIFMQLISSTIQLIHICDKYFITRPFHVPISFSIQPTIVYYKSCIQMGYSDLLLFCIGYFLEINISRYNMYIKTIRQLTLVVYERVVKSGFAFVDYLLIDNLDSLSNC